jgi:hypothetical protein
MTFGNFDIVYTGTERWMRALLTEYGFRQTDDGMVKIATAMTCKSWKECLDVTRKRYPHYLLPQRLKIAKTLYKGKRVQRPEYHLRSKRAVSVRQGLEILRDYLQQRWLESQDVNPKTKFRKQWETRSNSERIPVLQFVNAVRKHLLRMPSKKPDQHLTQSPPNMTWKFRPNPNRSISAASSGGGPDQYYLAGLDATCAPGRAFFLAPLGDCTPLPLRWDPKQPVSEWKTHSTTPAKG